MDSLAKASAISSGERLRIAMGVMARKAHVESGTSVLLSFRQQFQAVESSGGFEAVPEVQPAAGVGGVAPVRTADLRAAEFAASRGIRGQEDHLTAIGANQ